MIMYVDLNVNGPLFFSAFYKDGWIMGKYNLRINCTKDTNIWACGIT